MDAAGCHAPAACALAAGAALRALGKKLVLLGSSPLESELLLSPEADLATAFR